MLDELAGQDAHTTMLMLTSVRVHDLTRDYLAEVLLLFCNLVRTVLIEAFVWSGAALFFAWLRRLSKPSVPPRSQRPVPSCAVALGGAMGPYRSSPCRVQAVPSPAARRPLRWHVVVMALVVVWVAFGAVDVSFHAVRFRG